MKKSILFNGEKIEISSVISTEKKITFSLNGKEYSYDLLENSNKKLKIRTDNGIKNIYHHAEQFVLDAREMNIESNSSKRKRAGKSGGGDMTSPMPGKVLKVMVNVGQKVSSGDSLLVMEAMKMEHTIKASKDGVIKTICFSENELVDGGVELIKMENE